MKKNVARVIAAVLVVSAMGMAQIVPTEERTPWFLTSKVDEMTSKTRYTFHAVATSEAKAEFQLLCFDGAWKTTSIVVNKPVGSRYIAGFLIVAEVRLDDGVPYYEQLGVLDDLRTIVITDDREQRRMVRAKKVALQYQTIGSVNTVVVFRPQALDPNTSTKYCGANPQDELPLQLRVERGSGKLDNDPSDWILYQVDGGQEKETHVSLLPLELEARSTIRVSVGSKAVMKAIEFRLNGRMTQSEWRPTKDRYSRFTVMFQEPVARSATDPAQQTEKETVVSAFREALKAQGLAVTPTEKGEMLVLDSAVFKDGATRAQFAKSALPSLTKGGTLCKFGFRQVRLSSGDLGENYSLVCP